MSICWTDCAISKEEAEEAMEMHLCDDYYEGTRSFIVVDELREKYKLISIVDADKPFVICLLVDPKLNWEAIRWNIKGLVYNDGRHSSYIKGFFYGDVQGAYNWERVHGHTFHVYYGMWQTIFLAMFRESFEITYMKAPSRILATTGVFDVLDEFANLHTTYGSIKYTFIEKNLYPSCEPGQGHVDPPAEIILGKRKIHTPRLVFDFRKVTRVRQEPPEKRKKMLENEKPDPIDVQPNFDQLPAVQKFMICERCIRNNPLRPRFIMSWGTKPYIESRDKLVKKYFTDIDNYMECVKSNFKLISLADKEKDFVITILYDSFIHISSLHTILYKYADGVTTVPITLYIYPGDLGEVRAKQTSYNYDVFYDKWGYYFKRIYPLSYAIPAYVYRRKYFNYNFIIREFAHILEFKRDKQRPGFCYFEHRKDYITQELDDETEYKPNPMPVTIKRDEN